MMMDAAQSPDQSNASPAPRVSEPLQEQSDTLWRKEVLDLLTQLVLVQKEMAQHQVQVVQLLNMLGTQVCLLQLV